MGHHAQHADGFPGGFVEDEAQKVASKLGLPHYLLAVATLVVSSLVSTYFGGGSAGPAGPPGKPGVTTPIGVCIYYGLNDAGKGGMHLLTPNPDGTCTKGWYLSLKPGK